MEEEVQPIVEDAQPGRLRRLIKECGRVLRITKKPNKVDYMNTLKVTSLGIGLIGALGFMIFLLRQLLF
ncbi:protein translocase SEC61 complex subunit gamma [Candidatus Woesearchaeota archaeon]|nr:protein translocase SEC61 complex subunit gamma [Candidatus Woesearchaeota archaeon]